MFEKWVTEKLLPNLNEPSFGLFILEEFIIEARRRATLNLELNGIGNDSFLNLPFCPRIYVITSTLQTLYTELKNKVALSSKDDKRCVQPDGIFTYAWGNCKVEKNEKLEELLRVADRILNGS
ncbi:hypothetical protein NQ315_017458 [Exocentrus adspersus]|uniref:Uncharacterized protein n=1 Tax=Exocentrus adspersus TaxID=1586481 RepID=A0AAV8VK57_9CUCU|nr:hypothetical protein NQ315_017458 [Exocentrus adspersus]